jgi:hypothetical protein
MGVLVIGVGVGLDGETFRKQETLFPSSLTLRIKEGRGRWVANLFASEACLPSTPPLLLRSITNYQLPYLRQN